MKLDLTLSELADAVHKIASENLAIDIVILTANIRKIIKDHQLHDLTAKEVPEKKSNYGERKKDNSKRPNGN